MSGRISSCFLLSVIARTKHTRLGSSVCKPFNFICRGWIGKAPLNTNQKHQKFCDYPNSPESSNESLRFVPIVAGLQFPALSPYRPNDRSSERIETISLFFNELMVSLAGLFLRPGRKKKRRLPLPEKTFAVAQNFLANPPPSLFPPHETYECAKE
jgi:hypothetical protein